MDDDVPGWERLLARLATSAEGRFDAVKERLGSDGPAVIAPYRSWGTRRELVARGRVIGDPGLEPARAEDDLWTNVLNMVRRLESDERAGVLVEASFAGHTVNGLTDAEGYFELRVPVSGLPEDRLWHTVDLALADGSGLRATADVMVPSPDAELAVVSDLDDTVVRTGATDLLRMARTVFLGNAYTRVPFPGVSAFYAALHEGRRQRPVNPIFYVSSSPWNLYDLLADFLRIQAIPLGPVVLRDWGVSERELLPVRHRAHKRAAIRGLLETYPDLPFVLVGDSGQEDPEIYAEIVAGFPGRIRTMYIRDVTQDEERTAAMAALAEGILAAGGRLVVVDDTLGAARDAAEQGYVEPEAVAAVEGRRDAEARPAEPPEAPGTVVIAPPHPPAARAVVETGVLADTLAERPAQHAEGHPAPNVVVESPEPQRG